MFSWYGLYGSRQVIFNPCAHSRRNLLYSDIGSPAFDSVANKSGMGQRRVRNGAANSDCRGERNGAGRSDAPKFNEARRCVLCGWNAPLAHTILARSIKQGRPRGLSAVGVASDDTDDRIDTRRIVLCDANIETAVATGNRERKGRGEMDDTLRRDL